MEILFLGTSGYGITKTRDLPSIIIDQSILLDCGEGCFRNLVRHNISLPQIKAIFLSHLHADHCLGLITLLFKWAFYSNNMKKRKSLPIYIPKGMKSNFEAIINATFSTFRNANFELNLIELDPDHKKPLSLKINRKSYSVDWVQTNHSPTCFAYKINGRVSYSGDTAPFNSFASFISNCKILIHESSFPDGMGELAHRIKHSTPLDAAKVAKKGQCGALILTHVPDLSAHEEEGFIKEAKKIFSPITIAHDGDRFFIGED